MRNINWRYFCRPGCPGCAHPSRVEAGAACPECEAIGEAFVDGFQAAAWAALSFCPQRYAEMPSSVWMVYAPKPSGQVAPAMLTGNGWGTIGPEGFPTRFDTREHAEAAAREAPPWWPLQPWEVEA